MPNYVLQDDYLASGYVDGAYVGAADDLYVEAGYIQDAKEGVVSVSAVSTVTAKGGFFQTETVSASISATISVDADVIREATISINSAATATIDADAIRHGSASSNSAVSVLSSAVSTLRSTITPISAGTTQVSAVAIVDRSSDISVSTSVSVDGVATKLGSVDIQAFQTHDTTWGDDVTWDSPVGTIWGPMVDVDAKTISLAAPPGTLESRFTFTVDGDVTAIAEIAPAAVATVDAVGTFIVNQSADIASAFDTDVNGDKVGIVANIELDGVFDVSASGIFQVAGYPESLDGAFAVAVDGDVIRDGITINAGAFSVTDIPLPLRIRPGTATIDAALDFNINAAAFTVADITSSSAFGMDVSAERARDNTITSSAAFTTTRWVGGVLIGGIIDIEAFATTVSALTLYNIDPYRVYVVDSETRLLGITQETRIYTAKSENRLNSIEAENRLTRVPTETRTLEVQPLALVELVGTKDRRTG